MSVELHGILGWAVLTLVLFAAFHARARVRSGRAFEAGVYRVTAVLVDVQVLLGVGVWAEGRWWERDALLQGWIHPVLAVLTVALVHVGVKRARDERWAAEAYGIAGRTLLGAAVLLAITGGIGITA